MPSQDEKLESILAEPWLAKQRTRWSLSLLFVLVVLFALKPLIVQNLLARAEAYTSYGLYSNAVRECKKVTFLDHDNILAWNVMGSSYKNQDDIDNAVIAYLTAININPDNVTAHFKVAMIFALQQNYNRAIPHFEKVRYLGPEYAAAFSVDSFSYYRSSLEMLSLCYEKVGRPNKQQIILEELARTYPGYKKALGKSRILSQTSQTSPNTD